MRRNQSGSVLAFVMVLALVGSIALLGVQRLAYRSNRQIVRRVEEKQVFYLARSAAEAVAGEITYTDGTLRPFSSLPGHNALDVSGLDAKVGACTIDLYLEESTPDGADPEGAPLVARQVTITATAIRGEGSHTTTIVLRNYKGEPEDMSRWQDMVDYYIYAYHS